MKDTFLKETQLQYEVKALKNELERFRNGTQYRNLRRDYEYIIDGFRRENESLKKQVEEAEARTARVRNIWFADAEENWKTYVKELDKKEREIERLQDKQWKIIKKYDDRIADLENHHLEENAQNEAIIAELKNQLAHATALLSHDGSNTNTPTAQTPSGKKKRIPNSREKSGKAVGGQEGHEKHTLEAPVSEEEATDTIPHPVQEGECCPVCGSENLIYTGDSEKKWEYDIEVVVKKRLHEYYTYVCADCGEMVRTGIAPNLRADCQYGSNVQAFALSLMNTANTPINKVGSFIAGITNGVLTPCDGYIAKLQKRAAKGLKEFMAELRRILLSRRLIYWDDTVVSIDTVRGCLRFYGDETIAYYTAHMKKDMIGIDEDGLLELLSRETKVMHDHNTLNYNARFLFDNIECNAHLQRDIQKSADDTTHAEFMELKKLIGDTMHERNQLMEAGVSGFGDEFISSFRARVFDILTRAEEAVNTKPTPKYAVDDAMKLIRRVRKYYDNYFAWVSDFTLPSSNNLSERALRGVKSHIKISGQFKNVESARNYATIRSYTETCRRNGINEIVALRRLCEGNPYTINEIFHLD